MIDRTHPNPPLTANWLKIAFLISLGIFFFLIALAFVFWLIGVVSFLACWLWIILSFIVLFALALVPAIVSVAIVAGVANSGKQEEEKAAGCAGVIVLIALAWFYSTWSWWSTLTSEAFSIEKKTSVWASSAYLAMWHVAADTWNVFVVNEVYIWAWLVLAIGLCITIAFAATIGVARIDAPIRRITAAVRYQCPRCRTRSIVHRCPSCSNEHDDVAPSRHGIWTAQCGYCPTPLGTTGWTGLLKLPRECASCRHKMSHPDLGRLPEFHIAVIGARSSGKSTLIAAALVFLEDIFGPTHGLQIVHESDLAERNYRNRLRLFGSGEQQPTTPPAERPVGEVLSVKPKHGGGGFLLYLYDASGEDQEAGDSGARPGITKHDFHEFIDAAILTVDPTAEEGLRQKAGVAARGGHGAYEVLTRMIQFWQLRRGVSAGGRFRFPLAVVVTKMDAGTLSSEVGAGGDLSKRIGSAKGLKAVATSASWSVRKMLAAAGENDLLQLVESHFRNVKFFAASAQGRACTAGNRTAFRSQGAFAPFAWMLAECGAITHAPGLVRVVKRSMHFFGRCLRGLEGSRLRRLAWASVVLSAPLPVLAAWWYLGVEWAVVGLLLAVLGVGVQIYRSREQV